VAQKKVCLVGVFDQECLSHISQFKIFKHYILRAHPSKFLVFE